MRPVSKELSEICYPFIYEDSPVCDFEITADELCSRIGLVLSMELDDFSRDILTRLQPNVYHLNGSVRGKLAITESEVEELKADYEAIKARIDGGFKGFVLPGGHATSSQLHLCRCQAKKNRSSTRRDRACWEKATSADSVSLRQLNGQCHLQLGFLH